MVGAEIFVFLINFCLLECGLMCITFTFLIVLTLTACKRKKKQFKVENIVVEDPATPTPETPEAPVANLLVPIKKTQIFPVQPRPQSNKFRMSPLIQLRQEALEDDKTKASTTIKTQQSKRTVSEKRMNEDEPPHETENS